MKYFLDTEFIEDGKTIDLISIGLVADDGRELYLQNSECQFARASDWVWRNVFPHLLHFDMRGRRNCAPVMESEVTVCVEANCPWATRFEIRDQVKAFCDPNKDGRPEFWGYFADYDWVAFCQLFGSMVDLPRYFPMYCRDLKQWADVLGGEIPETPRMVADSTEPPEIHHALMDAKWNREAYEFLRRRQNEVFARRLDAAAAGKGKKLKLTDEQKAVVLDGNRARTAGSLALADAARQGGAK